MTNEQYIEEARAEYQREGEIEIDDGGVVSRGSDPGAYVAAWVWVESDNGEASEDDPDRPEETQPPAVNSEREKRLTVTAHEFDIILAALRVYQTMLQMNSAVCQDVEDIATAHGDDPTPEEIDALCERLNGGA